MSGLPASDWPLDFDQTNKLQTAVDGLTPQQLQWVSGYAAGLAAANAAPSAVTAAVAGDAMLSVLYGSQTGNGEAVATALARQAESAGFNARAVSLADFKPAHLKRESLLTFVISTHGEGEPPDDAELFYEYLMSEKAPQLKSLKYSVLALGDSSYVNFCATGRELDARLSALGATRFAALVECDLDFEDAADVWRGQVVAALPELLDVGKTAVVPVLRAVENTVGYDKSNPFAAEILVNQKITGSSSSKDVRHIELSLDGSGLEYEPGDSLAVLVSNPPLLVDELLSALNLDAQAGVVVRDQSMPIADALRKELEITALSLTFLRAWAAAANSDELQSLLASDNTKLLTRFVDSHQIIDVVRQFPAVVDAAAFSKMLRRLSPRSYSISSSFAANPDEVHITVAAVRYNAFGTPHWGAASTHLADRLAEGDSVPVYIERNSRFRLPAPDVPVIMIGPGTGVAPFRAFVEERVEQGAPADNWLFFGDRNFDSDFLYQLEWLRHLKQGALQRLDVAFSRDQRNKIYVQDRIRENGTELYRWLDNGAVIYVCGDAKHMAGDVNEALIDVLAEHGKLTVDAAAQKLKALRSEGRYQRDVY